MTRRLLSTAALLTAALFTGAAATQADAESVELELALLVDSSGSIDTGEFQLQMDGYIDAFRHPSMQELIAEQDGVAVELYHWSSLGEVRGTGWRVLRTEADCEAFANLLEGFGRIYNNSTIMAPAISTAMANIASNGIASERQVIDVSGDGIGKMHPDYVDVGDGPGSPNAAAWADVTNNRPPNMTINAISIGPDPTLKAWYASALPQGDGAFALHAESFAAFGDAIMQKLMREIAAPLPTERASYD